MQNLSSCRLLIPVNGRQANSVWEWAYSGEDRQKSSLEAKTEWWWPELLNELRFLSGIKLHESICPWKAYLYCKGPRAKTLTLAGQDIFVQLGRRFWKEVKKKEKRSFQHMHSEKKDGYTLLADLFKSISFFQHDKSWSPSKGTQTYCRATPLYNCHTWLIAPVILTSLTEGRSTHWVIGNEALNC